MWHRRDRPAELVPPQAPPEPSSRRPARAIEFGPVDWAALLAAVGPGGTGHVSEPAENKAGENEPARNEPAETDAAEDGAAEIRDVLAEETGELFELVKGLHDAVVSPEHLAAGHIDTHGAEHAEPTFAIVMPFLTAALNGWLAAGHPDHVRLVEARFYAKLRLAIHVASLPTTVDPAVSFGRGSCCIARVSPLDEVTVGPGGSRQVLERADGLVLTPFMGLLWAGLMRKQPGTDITARQAGEIDAWQRMQGSRRRQPLVALVQGSAGSAEAEVPACNG
jgi:hypothetical protein